MKLCQADRPVLLSHVSPRAQKEAEVKNMTERIKNERLLKIHSIDYIDPNIC